MKISSKARNAIRLMVDLADNSKGGKPVTLKEVARRKGISKRYLENLATQLRIARLVLAISGRGGGYRLARAPEKITLAEVLDAIMGKMSIVECVSEPQICPRADKCPTRKIWVVLQEQILSLLDQYTVADLSEMGMDEGPFCQSAGLMNTLSCGED